MTGILIFLCVAAVAAITWWLSGRRFRAELRAARASRDSWQQLAVRQGLDLTAARKILDALADPGTIRADQVRVALERDGRRKAMQRKGMSSALRDPRNDRTHSRHGGGGDDEGNDD